jgi:hypothetical protein
MGLMNRKWYLKDSYEVIPPVPFKIAFLMEQTGEWSERRLNHSDGEAKRFYRDLKLGGLRVGMESDRIFPLVRGTAGRVGF